MQAKGDAQEHGVSLLLMLLQLRINIIKMWGVKYKMDKILNFKVIIGQKDLVKRINIAYRGIWVLIWYIKNAQKNKAHGK